MGGRRFRRKFGVEGIETLEARAVPASMAPTFPALAPEIGCMRSGLQGDVDGDVPTVDSRWTWHSMIPDFEEKHVAARPRRPLRDVRVPTDALDWTYHVIVPADKESGWVSRAGLGRGRFR